MGAYYPRPREGRLWFFAELKSPVDEPLTILADGFRLDNRDRERLYLEFRSVNQYRDPSSSMLSISCQSSRSSGIFYMSGGL